MTEREIDSVEKPSKSIWKRLLLAAGALLLLLIATGIGWDHLEGSCAASRLARMLAQLDEKDPGWRLEAIEAARPTPPEEANSARRVVEVYRLLPKSALDQKIMEPLDKLPLPPILLDESRADLLERELKPVASVLEFSRGLAQMPAGRHHLTYAPHPVDTVARLNDQQNTRAVVRLLRYDALNLSQKNDAKAALNSCRTMLNAARSLDDEPITISQAIRIACVAISANSIERTLAQGEPPVEDLASLQKLVEEEEAQPTLLIVLRGERALQHHLYIGLADGSASLAGAAGGAASGSDWLSRWFMKRVARDGHPRMLEILNQAVDIARLPAHEQSAAEKALTAEVAFAQTHSETLIQLLIPALLKFSEASRRKLAGVRCLMVLLAVERYRREKGAWPAKLEELTPKLLKAVPLDPYDGKPLRYKLMADGVIVYSVGPDRTDNGGNIDRARPIDPGTDLGYQLWDVKHRRQPAPKAK